MVNDTIAFVKNIITTEINSATDNPVSFDGLLTCDYRIPAGHFKIYITSVIVETLGRMAFM